MSFIVFDLEKYKKLKLLYEKAVKDNIDVITLEDKEIAVSYAKYILEHLENKFKKGS